MESIISVYHMGQQTSTPIHILVIGLTNAGKTHFLDMFHLGPDSTKSATFGYYETVYYFENYEIIMTEYGGSIDWKLMLKMRKNEPKFHCIYFVCSNRSDLSPNLIESSNALLMVSSLLNVPVAILWNGERPPNFRYPKNRPLCSLTLNFENHIEWLSKTYKLFEWTISVTKNSA